MCACFRKVHNMFLKFFLLLIPTITSCLNYAELPEQCLDCSDPNGNVEMTDFFKPNRSWICSGELCPSHKKESKELTVDYFSIKSYIKHRYSTTYVMSQITNQHTKNQTTEFSIFIPSRAHLSRLTIEIDKKKYDSKIDKRSKRSEGKSSRTGNEGNQLRKFQIKTKLKPKSTVTYHLVYEELLARKNGKYRIDLNVHPGQIVKNLDIQVLINENQPLRFVKTPLLIKPGELRENISALNPQAEIIYKNKMSAIIKFQPNREQQEKFVKALKAKDKNGLDVQFRVHYDVERKAPGGEIITNSPYFVHYFAPEHLKPLPKYVIFVLDTSGSMSNWRLHKLRLSMEKILSQLKPEDLFSIIQFQANITVLDVASKEGKKLIIRDNEIIDYGEFDKIIKNKHIPDAVQATKNNTDKAMKLLEKFKRGGTTNIITSSQLAIHMVKKIQKTIKTRYEPIIILVTDGEPSYRNQTIEQSLKYITEYNKNIASIFSVGISPDVYFPFLSQLSALNRGIAVHIKNMQQLPVLLGQFFDAYSTPVLNNIRFLYGFNSTTLTKTKFTTFYEGTELIVAGKIDNLHIQPQVIANTQHDEVKYVSYFSHSTTSLDRIWAYLKTDQDIDDITSKKVSNNSITNTLNLALKYSLVTQLSSLTITSPDFGTINDDMLLKPIYQATKNLSSTKTSVEQTKIYRYVLPIDLSKKKP